MPGEQTGSKTNYAAIQLLAFAIGLLLLLIGTVWVIEARGATVEGRGTVIDKTVSYTRTNSGGSSKNHSVQVKDAGGDQFWIDVSARDYSDIGSQDRVQFRRSAVTGRVVSITGSGWSSESSSQSIGVAFALLGLGLLLFWAWFVDRKVVARSDKADPMRPILLMNGAVALVVVVAAGGYFGYKRSSIEIDSGDNTAAASTDDDSAEGETVAGKATTLTLISCADGAASIARVIIDNSDAASTGVVDDNVMEASYNAYGVELSEASLRSDCGRLEMACLVPGALKERQLAIETPLWDTC